MDSEKDAETVRQTLTAYGLDAPFSDLFEMRIGHIRTTEDYEHAFQMEPVMSALRNMPPSADTEVLLNNLGYATYPYLISLDSYNRLLSAAGMPELSLEQGEAAVCIYFLSLNIIRLCFSLYMVFCSFYFEFVRPT